MDFRAKRLNPIVTYRIRCKRDRVLSIPIDQTGKKPNGKRTIEYTHAVFFIVFFSL